MTNKERCKKCIHRCVCQYQDYFINVDHLGERCRNHLSKDKIKSQKAEIDRLNAKIQSIYKELERIALMTVETNVKEMVCNNG